MEFHIKYYFCVNSNKSIKPKVQSIGLSVLTENFEDKQIVNPKILHQKGFISQVDIESGWGSYNKVNSKENEWNQKKK